VATQARRTQQRATYRLEREFDTIEDFDQWWNEEGSIGWKLEKKYVSKKTKVETNFYR
jgi:hypothetical protein